MCGVIFARLEPGEAAAPPPRPAAEDPLAPNRPDATTAMTMGIGLLGALVCLAVDLLKVGMGGLKTLIHEFGHAAVSWLFGAPGIPSFDFVYGGGVAQLWPQKTGLLVLVYAAVGGLLVAYRRNPLTVGLLAAALAVYVPLAHSRYYHVAVLFMGHGMELVFAGIFLYRAWANRSIVNPLERPVYALAGWFLVLANIGFAWAVMHDAATRAWYFVGKGAIQNDFIVIARRYLQVPLDSVVGFFLFCCFLPPVVAFLLYRYQARVYLFIDRVVEREPGGA
jgi:hypothetical protein